MTFVITLISLVIERFFHWSHLRHWRWFNHYQRWLLNTRLSNWSQYLLLAATVLPLVLVVGVVNAVLDNWLYGLGKLVFGVAVLMYCLGPSNLWVQVYSCINELQKEDLKPAIERVHAAFGIGMPEHSQAFHQAFVRAIFIAAYQRIFAVVFWFVILGPLGAVLYRSIALCRAESPLGLMSVAAKLQQLLDWIPVRIFTFIFALGGHFTQVFAYWKKQVTKGVSVNDTLLTECGVLSLDVLDGSHIPEDGSGEREAVALLDRAFVMWLVILAVVVLLM